MLDIQQKLIHKLHYARWDESTQCRETWEKTVLRYIKYFKNRVYDKGLNDEALWEELHFSILNLNVMPSMRSLRVAGEAAKSCEVANYNCCAVGVDNVRVFSEILFILMSGTGCGFSVEKQFIKKIPEVPTLYSTETIIKFHDSRKGWAVGLNQFFNLLFSGSIPKWDLSQIRPFGARLKTFGGQASGPEPLEECLNLIIQIFKKAQGRKLISIELHSIICKIADAAIAGGTRRSALISIFDPSDTEMLTAKTGQWWKNSPHFALANNSAIFDKKPTVTEFLSFWRQMLLSKAGEPGILSREAMWKANKDIGRDNYISKLKKEKIPFLTNPCGEIILRPEEFCNLSAIVVRSNDTLKTLLNKAKFATFCGIIQTDILNFQFLRKSYAQNIKEERLLGVCLAGLADHPVLQGTSNESRDILKNLTNEVYHWSRIFSEKMQINLPISVTAIKPAGTSGLLYNCSPGSHPRFSKYYIRRIRIPTCNPVCKTLLDNGFSYEKDNFNENDNVFSFFNKSPKRSLCVGDKSALEQLRYYLHLKKHWATHSISQTIYYTEEESLSLAAEVYNNFEKIVGISFFPKEEHIYEQAPYEEITKEQYISGIKNQPASIDWSKLKKYEKEDNTNVSHQFACAGDKCEI